MAEMTLGAHFLAWLPTSQYAWILSVLPAARVLEVAGMGTHQPPGPDEDIAGRYVVHRLGHEPMGSYAGIAIAPIKLPNGDRYWRVVFKRPDGYYRMVHIPPNLLVVGEPVTPEALRLAVLRHDGNLEAAQAEIGNARTTGIAAAIQEAAKPTPTAELRSLRVVKAGCPCLVGLSLYDAHFGNLEGAAAFLAHVSATYVAHDRPYPPEVVLDVTWDVDGYLHSKLLPVELGHEWLWADAGAGFLSLLGAETGQVFHAPDHHGAVYYDHLGRWLQFMATSGEDWSERTRLITSIMGLGSGVAKVMGFMSARVADGFASLEEAADTIASYMPSRPRRTDLTGLGKNLRQHPDGRYRWHWDPRFVTSVMESRDTHSMEDFRTRVGDISIPVHLIRGRMSELVSQEAAQEFLTMLPQATFTDVENAGHMVAGDRNDAFIEAVVGFLSQRETVQ